MTRPRCSIFIATSLDGYIARSDGGLDWLEIVHPLDQSHGYDAFFASVDTIVVGRGTYDTVLAFPEWPYADKRVVVLTSRPAEPRAGVELVTGPVSDVVARLGSSTRVYVDGGKVIGQFLAAGLIDDLTLSIIPIVLGSGIRLFNGGEGEHGLTLDTHRSWPSGMVQLRYRVDAAGA